MDNPFKPGVRSDLEQALEDLPDQVAAALRKWREMTLEREKVEAILYIKFRGEDRRTSDEVKALVKSDSERYKAVVAEFTAESEYTQLYERLLSFKRLASHREAF